MATYSSILAWRIPWAEAIVQGVAKSRTRLINPLQSPGGLVVRTWHLYCGDPVSAPGGGTKILQEARCSQEKKKFTLLICRHSKFYFSRPNHGHMSLFLPTEARRYLHEEESRLYRKMISFPAM